MTRHYPDLGSDVSSEYGISALVSQTSFGGKTTGGVAKCRLFSQATTKFKCAKKWKINITMRKYCWKFFFWMATIPSTESKDRTIFCMAILMLTSPIDITRNILTRSALALIFLFSWHNLKLNKENVFRTCNEHNSSFFSSLVLLRIHSWRSKDSLYLLIS